MSLSVEADDPASVFATQRQSVGAYGLSVELRQKPDCGEFILMGLSDPSRWSQLPSAEWQKLFRVSVKSKDETSPTPSMLGTYQFEGNELKFASRFPLSSKVRYLVTLSSALDADSRERSLEFVLENTANASPSRVTHVFPSADVLPENTLKFYIHFSAPMSRGEAYERIHLLQEDKEVEAPFLELGEELWDADQMRFTLFIHPGRIKRGVKPRMDNGLPLVDGKRFSLVVDQAWRNADGVPMESRFLKTFTATASDDEQPNPEKWRIGTPKANSTDRVSLTFNEPLDHAMLSRVLQVLDADRRPIAGKTEVTEHETVWSFLPTTPWKKGVYMVDVASNIEDLAGNSIARPFETRSGVETDSTPPPPRVGIEFVVE
jgi:hypothetical protein